MLLLCHRYNINRVECKYVYTSIVFVYVLSYNINRVECKYPTKSLNVEDNITVII